MRNEDPSNLDFTVIAKRSIRETVRDPYFRDGDYDLIYDLLKDKMRIVSFGDYLKRYIYRKAEMTGDYQSIPLSDYQSVICCEFADRNTPCSFAPTTVKLANAARNWLEQQSVNRNVVLLLGFGLGMSAADVNDFLTKALQEPGLNVKDPFETVCFYCYRNGYLFDKYDDLWKEYLRTGGTFIANDVSTEATIGFRNRFITVHDDRSLMSYLAELSSDPDARIQSVTGRKHFNALYALAREYAAQILTESDRDTADKMSVRMEEQLGSNDQLYDFQKLERIRKEKGNFNVCTADDITPADFESIMFSAVPKDKNGNLASMKSSTLNRQFRGKRLSRQHISQILSGKAQITRYDLITLNFFNHAQDYNATRPERYNAFIDTTNRILKECGMETLYVVNPYESFLLMCMLSLDPLGTYADVWELSYGDDTE